MNIIKYPICVIMGHKLESPSIIEFIDKGNYLKKCSRCGLYKAASALDPCLTLTVSERTAKKMKDEFEECFQSSKEGEQE